MRTDIRSEFDRSMEQVEWAEVLETVQAALEDLCGTPPDTPPPPPPPLFPTEFGHDVPAQLNYQAPETIFHESTGQNLVPLQLLNEQWVDPHTGPHPGPVAPPVPTVKILPPWKHESARQGEPDCRQNERSHRINDSVTAGKRSNNWPGVSLLVPSPDIAVVGIDLNSPSLDPHPALWKLPLTSLLVPPFGLTPGYLTCLSDSSEVPVPSQRIASGRQL
ncbi:hypothetical protein Q5P01_024272 [Channa striata]|uniref:Uncharacterized protein n=1 Tax=Channa striata TaxID=64152 RepID=A0AA88LIR8_CHASR|nr:hypothetical protein Q5P01_024272 [Channa striata]